MGIEILLKLIMLFYFQNRLGVVKTACQLQQRALDEIAEVPMFTSILEGLQQKKKKSKKKVQRSVVAFL